MKVAIVHSFYSSAAPSGENETVVAQHELLARSGIETRIFEQRTDVLARARAYPVEAALTVATGRGRSPLRDLLAFSPDVIHVHNLFPNWGSNWIKKCPIPVVATLHNFRTVCSSGILWRDGHDCTECITRGSHRAVRHACYRGSRIQTLPLAIATRGAGAANALLSDTDGLIVLNSGAREFMLTLVPGGIPVSLIPNFAPRSGCGSNPNEARTRWLYAGRLAPEKGVTWLAENWPEEAEPLDVVGGGPELPALAKIVASKPNVVLWGQLAPSDVREKMRRSKGLLVPSLWSEGVPTVALEALAEGTPLVISESCAAAEELTGGGKAGVVFSPDEGVTPLSDALAIVRNSHEGLKLSSLEHYKLVFSEDRWLNQMVDFYGSVISRQGSSSEV